VHSTIYIYLFIPSYAAAAFSKCFYVFILGIDQSESEPHNGESKTENEPDTSNEPHEELAEGEDDIPEGDEFVEWNEGEYNIYVTNHARSSQ